MKRIITIFEEKVLRCIHHDFEGKTQQDAAIQLKCSQSQISDVINRLKQKVPQFFPILTKNQSFILNCICEEGLTHKEISALLGISENTLKARIVRLKKKDTHFEKAKKTLQYKEYMDVQVENVF